MPFHPGREVARGFPPPLRTEGLITYQRRTPKTARARRPARPATIRDLGPTRRLAMVAKMCRATRRRRHLSSYWPILGNVSNKAGGAPRSDSDQILKDVAGTHDRPTINSSVIAISRHHGDYSNL